MSRDPRKDRARRFRVEVSGFDFTYVYAWATGHSRARSIVARAYEDAGWGSFGDGLRHIRSCRVDIGPGRRLANPRLGPEGLCATLS